MVTSAMHISDTWLKCRHGKEAEERWEGPHLANRNTDELLCSEYLLHTSLAMLYFFTFIVSVSEMSK